MMLDSETRRMRAKQVGMLMQAYRRSFMLQGEGGRLSQEGLLGLMGQVDPKYLERYNHSTVARWESGATRPTEERLKVFGQALKLTPAEVEGLIRLAGFHEEPEAAPLLDGSNPRTSQEEKQAPADDAAESAGETQSFLGLDIRFTVSRLVLPGLGIAAAGLALAYSGWNAPWVMILYVSGIAGLMLAQSFLRLRRASELRELYFISVFFLLSANLLQGPMTGMDPFGYYAIGDFASTPMPFLLALLTNLLMAFAAGLLFDFLCRRQYAGLAPVSRVWPRTACTAFMPLLMVYAASLFLTGLGTWIYLLLVFCVVGGVFTALLILREEGISFTKRERRLLLQAGVVVAAFLAGAGGAMVSIACLEPGMLAVPDHTLIRSWDIHSYALGYPEAELMDRYRLGAVWSAIATAGYLVIVLGRCLWIAVCRLENEGDSGSGGNGDAGSATTPAHGRS